MLDRQTPDANPTDVLVASGQSQIRFVVAFAGIAYQTELRIWKIGEDRLDFVDLIFAGIRRFPEIGFNFRRAGHHGHVANIYFSGIDAAGRETAIFKEGLNRTGELIERAGNIMEVGMIAGAPIAIELWHSGNTFEG